MVSTRKFDLENRLVEFTIKIINVVESLPDSKVCNYLGGQLLRSGSSPVLNYGEAQAAESRRDFSQTEDHFERVKGNQHLSYIIESKVIHNRFFVN